MRGVRPANWISARLARLGRGAAAAAVWAMPLMGAGAETIKAGPSNYRAAILRLAPGDRLHLLPGLYLDGLRIRNLHGSAGDPIVIEGGAGGLRPLLAARPGHNTVSIANSSYVVIRNLDLDGRGLPVDGVKCEGDAKYAHHITLDNLSIRGHGNNQQTVGISTKCPAWGWVIRGNTIVGAGTGIYLGNSDGSAPFVKGLIEGNLVVDSVGYDLQIKHQAPWPALVGMPSGPSETVIRRNVFAKIAPLRTDAEPRPSVLVGHWPKTGPGSQDRYLIYDNFFYGNPAESLFQGEGNLALYNNLFVAPNRDAIRIQPHNDIPKNVVVAYNTVLARRAGIVLAPGVGSERYRQIVSHNAVFAAQPVPGAEARANRTDAVEHAGQYLVAPRFALEGLDLRPLPGMLRLPEGVPLPPPLPGMDADIAGRQRDPQLAGAYAEGAAPLPWMPIHE